MSNGFVWQVTPRQNMKANWQKYPQAHPPPAIRRFPDLLERVGVPVARLNPLSMKLLEGEFKLGDKIKVTAKDDVLIFQRK